MMILQPPYKIIGVGVRYLGAFLAIKKLRTPRAPRAPRAFDVCPPMRF